MVESRSELSGYLTVRLTGVHASVSQVLGGGSSMVTADRAAGSAMVGFSASDLTHGRVR